MSGKLVPLDAGLPTKNSIEWTFNAPFTTINAAMYHSITIGMAQKGRQVLRDDTPGAARYNLALSTGALLWLYVLQRGENITSVELHTIVRPGMLIDISPETQHEIAMLICDCWLEATRAMRYVHPDFTVQLIEGITPPMPKYRVDGWGAVFLWHAVYASGMHDTELADAQSVALQTISNARTKHKAHRRQLQSAGSGGKSKAILSKKK